MIIKYVFRNFLFPLALLFKIDKLLFLKNSKKNLILNFHGVTNVNGHRFNNRHLDSNEFEKLIKYLNKNFKIVPLSQLFDIHRKLIPSEKPTISLTFDDGYNNNFTTALPILKKYNIPATFYIISESLMNNTFVVWPDMIDLVQKYATGNLEFSFGTFIKPGFSSHTQNISLIDFIKKSGEKRNQYLTEIDNQCAYWREHANKHPDFIQLITSDKLNEFKNEPLIEYGSHTHLHYNLEFLPENLCSNELTTSKRIIEEKTGRPVNSIAFPDGSYNAKTLELSKVAGYNNAVAVDYKLNENNKNPFILSRFTVSNSTTSESNILRLMKDFDKFAF